MVRRLQEQIKEFPKEANLDEKAFTIKSSLLLSICFLYILNFFINHLYIQIFLTVLTIAAFILCVTRAGALPRIFASLMFGAGLIIFLVKEEGLYTISAGINQNLPLLTLIILVPLISVPFRMGGFFQSIHYYLIQMTANSRKMFLSISVFLFCFGPILNLGSIRVAHEMVKDLKLNPIMLGKAYLVGFSTVILWSPYFASVALVLYYLNLSVSNYIFLGLSLAIVQLIIGNLLYRLYYNRVERPQQLNFKKTEAIYIEEADTSTKKFHLKKMLLLCFILILLMGCIFTLEHWTKWPMMLLVSIVAILFPILSTFITRKWKDAREQFEQFNSNLNKSMSNEVVMFISAGVFASSLTGTTFADSINEFLTSIASTSFLLFCITVVLMIVFLTYIGLHPIVVVTVLIMQLKPAVIGTTPEVLALLFMISWSISAALSPVNPLNLLVSNSVGRSGLIVGLKWNGMYILSMFVVGIAFVYLIH